MNKKEIESEIEKWEDENFLEEVKKELCNHVNDLDKILSKRYKIIIQELNPDLRERALKTLQAKGLFDENMEYIGDTDIVEFNGEKEIVNGGYINGKIIVNPNSAKQFYGAYIDFVNGKTDGIRNFDYRKPISELQDLSPLEVLYWHYFNEKSYQDFLKSTMLHEDVHRWTLSANFLDSPIDIFTMEGFVEKEARDIAEENNLEYAKCFRNDELKLIEYLLNGIISEHENAMLMLYCGNPESCLMYAMGMKVRNECGEISQDKVTKLVKEMYCELLHTIKENNTNSFGKNYREIFVGINTDKSDEIIKYIESRIAGEKGIGEDFTLKSGVEATTEVTRMEQINQEINHIKENVENVTEKDKQQTQVE